MKRKSSPTDNIPVVVLKNLTPHILLPLWIMFNMFNCFFALCEFPAEFKNALVVPLYKGKDKVTDSDNYRSISMLSNLSKLFEFCINSKLMSFVESNNSLDENQHGFRSGTDFVYK